MNNKINIKHQTSNIKHFNAFTFIETLVVIAVLGLVLPVLFSILFVILQQQLKIFRITEVKRAGDYIVQVLENSIKNNAYTIHDNSSEICEADPDPANPFPHNGIPSSFRDKYNSSFSINYNSPDLSLDYPDPVAPAPTFAFAQGQLNSSKVSVSSFSISCARQSIYSAPLVSINFSVCYNVDGSCISTRPEETASLEYQTSIKLKSYPTQ
ncbi:hypothetical protein A3A46_04645 [Candidatus Roizmanbacteria bacterium RIFCSPLOWO2_01_FULL_37_13]|uniref:Uncharacterized protein n=1 Tax=Candidatus Roizmanbacteria bacterium RIFCSPHIGHO2_02_FULL_38_11 TaxID=1802039 RepID=A0A1F7GWW7_9BACT|nr:MAG: hypothetical protein A3C25_04795 [Candidatus Roizmanbacteria bacterium RIFCSPHIGHO2_02_FULL_38_11]OGK33002.1 MAG: hypothetical protein A3F58_03145 [Candidatus Roizmanbacteria bacterium RIFCSPHIGHO2_12_FULL_37_9b]OGK41192.1 MAG: hypothetical protein A3A46_04645 [Candidatus Roizmanbacteria bacterium RIFCSPLOWO2_01_FULL_37_13]